MKLFIFGKIVVLSVGGIHHNTCETQNYLSNAVQLQIPLLQTPYYTVLALTISNAYSTWYINGLVQERRHSIANALELRLSCTNPSILYEKSGNLGQGLLWLDSLINNYKRGIILIPYSSLICPMTLAITFILYYESLLTPIPASTEPDPNLEREITGHHTNLASLILAAYHWPHTCQEPLTD